MALVRGADPVAGPSRWLPTHVQVTVLRARGLRGKSSGAGSTSDAYTVIQLGREKYSTSVVEKTPGCPEWREECSFELPPGALDGLLRAQEADAGPAPWAAGAAAACELVLTTMHRSLIGVDKFLGQATVPLDEVFGAGRAQHTEWYKLHSKAGKREKERGEIQVSIQFTRNNLSASMFDLSVKDKPRSPFSKIKDKMKGKKKYDLESASAILPSSALEDPDLGGLGKVGKAKGFFLRNKLRKSSLTQSSTSLGSDSTLSSASGTLAFQGPAAELLTRSPSRSSWLSSEGGKDSTQSPKLFSHKRTYSDEASQVRAVPRSLLDLQGHLDSASRSSLCVNGSHVYNEMPTEPLRHRSSISGPFPASSSLHTVSARPSEEGPRPADEPWGRGSCSASSSEVVPGPEEPSTQPRALAMGASRSGEEAGARLPEGKPIQVATPMVASSETDREGTGKEERKPRMGLFHHHPPGLSRSELGRRSSLGEKAGPTLGASPHHSSSGEEKVKSGWFGLREAKEVAQKPSLDVSPQVEPGPAALPHHLPCSPRAAVPAMPAPSAAPTLSSHLSAASPAAGTAVTTPEAAPAAVQSGASAFTNPFLSSLQSSPFFDELVALKILNYPSPHPSLPSASRASPPPRASPGPSPTDPECDDTFNIFAASRLCAEAGRETLAPTGVGLETPGAGTVEAAEPPGAPEGGQAGSSVWLEAVMPVDLGLTGQSASTEDQGPSALLGTRPPPGASALGPPAPGGDTGQSPAGSPASLFSFPEVISVWERLPSPDDTPEGQDEAAWGTSQLLRELNVGSDSWPWDVLTISPAAEVSSPVLKGASEELPDHQVGPESPGAAVSPQGSRGLLPPELEREPTAERRPEEQPQGGMPPPKPPRLFIPGHSQEEEEEEEEVARRLPDWRPETAEDVPGTPVLDLRGAEEEEGENPESEGSDGHSSATLLDELGQESGVGEDASPSMSPSHPSLPTACPEDPIPTAASSESVALETQQIWRALEQGESPVAPEAQSQGPGEEPTPMLASSQHTDLWASEEDTLNPFLSQDSQDPPSFPSTSPPGSRESSILSGPEELPTPPEPTFPPPSLPPWASHLQGGLSLECSPLSLSGAWPLTSSSPPQEGPASPPGPSEPSPTEGSPTPLGDDHAAATPASPLVLLPLETRPVELQPGASPHPVKPLSATPVEGSPDRKPARSSLSTALSSGLEKLKTVTSGSVQPVVPAPQVGQTVDAKKLKDSGALDQSARYYHLTHDELISLLLQREQELSQRDEHVQELESYIDRLLVRIMETSPTLLQIPTIPPK